MKTDAAITAHNKQNNTWKMEHNKFSDLVSKKFYDLVWKLNLLQ